jgi:exopolysaccharide biosynthesis protein
MCFDVRLTRPALGAFGALVLMGVAAAQPTTGHLADKAAIGVVVPGDCWRGGAQGSGATLEKHLAQCASLGADMVTLQVKPEASGGLQACATHDLCGPLPAALIAQPSPGLLLDTPVALLDEVQRDVTAAGAASHVRVAPQFQRPDAVAMHTLQPGLRYAIERRSVPRPMMIHVLEIDLQQPGGFEFVTTSTLPGQPVSDGTQARYWAEKTSVFAQRNGLLAAINASYFDPFNGGRLLTRAYIPKAGQDVTVSEARLARDDPHAYYTSSDPRVDAVVCLKPHGFALSRTSCPAGSHAAFAAGPMLLEQGQRRPLLARDASQQPNEQGVARYYSQPQPRTALGVNVDASRAWMVVVDGRQSGYSEGITLPELTALLIELGAHDALNLDGGGSSTLVLEGRVANSLIHTAIPGRERPVANHFGVRAAAKVARDAASTDLLN